MLKGFPRPNRLSVFAVTVDLGWPCLLPRKSLTAWLADTSATLVLPAVFLFERSFRVWVFPAWPCSLHQGHDRDSILKRRRGADNYTAAWFCSPGPRLLPRVLLHVVSHDQCNLVGHPCGGLDFWKVIATCCCYLNAFESPPKTFLSVNAHHACRRVISRLLTVWKTLRRFRFEKPLSRFTVQ